MQKVQNLQSAPLNCGSMISFLDLDKFNCNLSHFQFITISMVKIDNILIEYIVYSNYCILSISTR